MNVFCGIRTTGGLNQEENERRQRRKASGLGRADELYDYGGTFRKEVVTWSTSTLESLNHWFS